MLVQPDDGDSRAAATRAVEFFLRQRLFRSERTGAVIEPAWLQLHYPVLALRYPAGAQVLAHLGPLTDARLQEPLDMLKAKRLPSINARVTCLRWLFRPDQSSR